MTGNSRIKIEGGLQNQVSDFNGLARKPLCYRYTIPQKQQQNQYIIESVYTGPGSNFLGPAGVSPSTRSVPVLASVRRGQLWLTERRDRGCAPRHLRLAGAGRASQSLVARGLQARDALQRRHPTNGFKPPTCPCKAGMQCLMCRENKKMRVGKPARIRNSKRI